MRRAFLLAFLAALPAAAMAQPREAPPQGQDVVVTGIRIQDYRDRLAACLARRCPPNEDIDATTALAESLFVAGEYRDARTALRASIGRNRDEAARYPEPVSDLYRANARVARHLGLDQDAQTSTREILRALRAGLPQEDHRHFTARLEIAQSLIAFGQYDQARRALAELAERARAAGRDDVVASAELRGLWLSYLQAPTGSAQRELAALSRSTDPRRSIGAKILLVRIYGERGQRARADALIAELGRSSQRRQLLFNPPFQLGTEDLAPTHDEVVRQGRTMDTSIGRNPGNMEDKWIDVAFWIQPDGSVTGLEIVRGDGARSWADPLLESIRRRRYSQAAGTEGTYRVERYTYTSGLEMRAGSHIMQRSPRARVEYFDLGGGAPSEPPPSATRENGVR
jgi:tetratricopeptide (TPR) repeat protein